MSVPNVPPPAPKPQGLSGCFVVFLILSGIILTLPGLCSLLFMISLGRSGMSRGDGGIGSLWLMAYLVAALGIALIYYAVRNRSR